MLKFINRSILTFLVFLFLYNPPLRLLPMNSGVMIGAGFMAYYFGLFLSRVITGRYVSFSKRVLMVCLIIAFTSLYSLFLVIIYSTNDFQVFKSYLSFLLFYIPGAFGIVKFAQQKGFLGEMLDVLIIVTVIQSIVILGSLFNVTIKNSVFSILKDTEFRIEKNESSGGFRFLGLAYGTTWDLAIIQSIGMMIIALKCKINSAHINFKNAAFFLLLAISVFLSARTGIFGILFSILILIIPIDLVEVPFRKILKLGGKLLLIIGITFLMLRSLVPSSIMELAETRIIPWAFELFIKNDSGKLETTSSSELKTMYFLPSAKTTLFGDGLYVSPTDKTHYYMDTDAGYMRHILFYGVVGSVFMSMIYLLVFYQLFRFSLMQTFSVPIRIFILFLCLYYFISHIKGDIFLGADMPIKLLFLLYAVFLYLSDPEFNDTEILRI